jgi:hypothetical protein
VLRLSSLELVEDPAELEPVVPDAAAPDPVVLDPAVLVLAMPDLVIVTSILLVTFLWVKVVIRSG